MNDLLAAVAAWTGWSTLAPAVQTTLAGILGVLVVAQVWVRIRSRRVVRAWRAAAAGSGGEVAYAQVESAPGPDEVALRVRTWWLLFGLFGGGLVLGRGFTIVVLALTSYLALKEYFSVIPTRRVDRRVLFWAYLAVPLQFLWVWERWYGMFIVFIPVYVTLIVQTRMILLGDTRGFLRAAATIHWGLLTTVFSLSHAAFLLELPAASAVAGAADTALGGGPGWILCLVLLTQACDVSQFLWGKSIGGAKVLPSVSPGKTWSGLLGGVGTTVVLAVLLVPELTPMSRGHAAVAGLLIAVGGFFGDLCISCIKRDLGIKDMGATLPGHGGILDRVDSLTYTAPLFFHFSYWLYG